MNIVIPLAGRGSRFLIEKDKNQEYGKPKPLINIAGKTMVEWALASYPLTGRETLIFIVRKEHVEEFQIDEVLKKIFGNEIKIIIQDTPPQGATATVLLAKDLINNETPLLITDSDHYIDGRTHFDIINNKNVDGAIPVFYANNPKWSFSKTDDEGYVIETAEKMQISRNANIGAYYFLKGRDFVWAAEEMIEEDDKTNNEFYVAPVYNYMIRRGKKIVLSRPRFVHGLGTPRDVEKFLEFLRLGDIEHDFDKMGEEVEEVKEAIFDGGNFKQEDSENKNLFSVE